MRIEKNAYIDKKELTEILERKYNIKIKELVWVNDMVGLRVVIQ